jgi:ABC-type transport system substrate-binding protein
VEGRSPAIQRWIRERGRLDFLFVDPTSIMFDAAYHIRLHLDLAHPMGRSPNARALEILNRADGERDPAGRAALLREIQGTVHDQSLSIPFYQVVDLYGVRNRVRGFVPSVDTILRLSEVTLAR